MKRQALSRELIDYCQHAAPSSIRQTLGDEIHAPLFVPAYCLSLRHTLTLRSLLAPFRSHNQSLLGVQTVNALGVYLPAFALQHHRQPPISIAHAAAGQFAQAHPQRVLRITMMLIWESRPVYRNQPRHAPLAQLVDLFGPLGKLATQARLYNFFWTISCRMCRSRLRSATSLFNLLFSSRSWRSSRSSL